jgi:hypothetical protein
MASALAMAHRFVAKGRQQVTDMAMPTEVRERFEREKEAYWQQRDELLRQYRGKWVAIVNGQVVAVGDQMNKVAAEAFRKTGSALMYVALVGGEDAVLRVRQVAMGYYDERYSPPMPMVAASVSDPYQRAFVEVPFILDTGADLSLLQYSIAEQLNLWDYPAGQILIAGIGGVPQTRQLYCAIVHLANRSVFIVADCREDLSENLLGRDVLNEFAVFLCAKRRQVQLEWVEG